VLPFYDKKQQKREENHSEKNYNGYVTLCDTHTTVDDTLGRKEEVQVENSDKNKTRRKRE